MSFQTKPLIHISRTSWYYKLYRASRDYMGYYDEEAHTVCDLFWAYWDALSYRVGSVLGPIVGWSMLGVVALAAIGLCSLLGFGFWALLQYWMHVYHGQVLLAVVASLGALLAILVGVVVAGVTCLLVVATMIGASISVWYFVTNRIGGTWLKVPAKRGTSFLRVVGQWIYDLAHGICTLVEVG